MKNMNSYKIPSPEFEKLFRAKVILRDAWTLGEVGTGYSEIVAVKDGKVEGKINGTIMDFGGDWGLLHSESVNIIDTKYLIKTDDDAFISVVCKGKMIMGRETMIKGCTGELIDPTEYYFRTAIEFSTGADKYLWLNSIVAFAIVMMTEEGNICQDVYALK